MTSMHSIPLDVWINTIVTWLYNRTGSGFNQFSNALLHFLDLLIHILSALPWWLVTAAFAALAYYGGKWRLVVGTVLGFAMIENLGMWNAMITTLVLVLVSTCVSLLIGFPLGVWCAQSRFAYRILSPILDVMQTMPSFVYLVPAVMFFSVGPVPAVLATVIFAIPPVIRLIRIGILQVPDDLVAAAAAFGANDWQVLVKLQLPLALPSIMTGINQTIMLSLSMVVVSAMIGAGGLGNSVMTALETVNIGQGFEAGLCIVILAIILDRISQTIGGMQRGSQTGTNN